MQGFDAGCVAALDKGCGCARGRGWPATRAAASAWRAAAPLSPGAGRLPSSCRPRSCSSTRCCRRPGRTPSIMHVVCMLLWPAGPVDIGDESVSLRNGMARRIRLLGG